MGGGEEGHGEGAGARVAGRGWGVHTGLGILGLLASILPLLSKGSRTGRDPRNPSMDCSIQQVPGSMLAVVIIHELDSGLIRA